MNAQNGLSGKKVAILATDGVEQVELTRPREALRSAGANVVLVSNKSGVIQGMHHGEKGDTLNVDMTLKEVRADDFDALVLPGGLKSPDTLRMDEAAVSFVRDFFAQSKPVASICHGPWLLVEADVVRGRKVTSYPSVKTDLVNAGAEWVNETCVVDEGLVTSRNPDDLPAFCEKMIEEFAEGEHAGQSASLR